MFSISPSVHPSDISIFNSSCIQYKPLSLFSNRISINQCKLTGRSLTIDFYAPIVEFVDNKIDTEDCLENINGYLYKFRTEKGVVFSGNELYGAKKENQYIVIPNEFAPECVISGNDARQYKTFGTFGKKANVKMSDNRLSGGNN